MTKSTFSKSFFKLFVCAGALHLGLASCAAQQPVKTATVAKPVHVFNAKSVVAVYLPQQPSVVEQNSAQELSSYLQRITGGQFKVVSESAMPAGAAAQNAAIFVGATQFAERNGLKPSTLAEEEWRVRSVGPHLLVAGGGSRGTLYAAYHFLESQGGVEWWNPKEELVPTGALALPRLNLSGRPLFRYRDIHQLYAYDEGAFAARNRVNRQGDIPIAARFGGELGYGPPYHVHTFDRILPPSKYFAAHPEWYGEVNGKPYAGTDPTQVGSHAQLQLMNMEMRAEFLEQMRIIIRKSRASAIAAGKPVPDIYSISQSDVVQMSTDAASMEVVNREGSQAGPLLDFVNWMSDNLKEEFPDIYIDTLAYLATEVPPKTIRPRDNVVIRLTDVYSNSILPITAPRNAGFQKKLEAWSKISKRLRVWDYGTTYENPVGLPPAPTTHTYAPDFRLMLANNVEGVFIQHDWPIIEDLRDLKVWLTVKLLENPNADPAVLETRFTDGFYGAAGKHVREYLRALEYSAREKPADIAKEPAAALPSYLDVAFMRQADEIFKRAEAAVAGNAVLERRVRHARMPTDRTLGFYYVPLRRQWERSGGTAKTFPLNREVAVTRLRRSWEEQAELRFTGTLVATHKAQAAKEINAYSTTVPPLPTKFADIEKARIYDFTADRTRNHVGRVKVVKDADSESGTTNRIEIPQSEWNLYGLPFRWGTWQPMNQKSTNGPLINVKDIVGPGYHWYHGGTHKIESGTYLHMFAWKVKLDLDEIYDPRLGAREYDVWFRIKFEGPNFPHGGAGATNAISVERVTLIAKE